MKKRILFVDDDPKILQALRLMLHQRRREWDMAFASSGAEALEKMEHAPFDIVISDMRMQGMDGSELLGHVRERYPQTARIILSGYSELESSSKAVKPAQHFLMKPCSSEVLQGLLDRILSTSPGIEDPGLRKVISGLESLPALPDVYVRLMEELSSSEPSIKAVGHIVEQDVGVSAILLKIVNSAFFGFIQTVNSPSQAVTLLGTEIMQGLVLGAHLFDTYDSRTLTGMSLPHLWGHSLQTGYLAKSIAAEYSGNKKMPNQCFIAGMLHDLGKLVMAINFPERYQRVIDTVRGPDVYIHTVEREIFGASHAEVGAYLLQTWSLPETVVQGVRLHHALEGIETPEHVAIPTHVANRLEHELRVVNSDYTFSPLDQSSLERLDLLKHLDDWKLMSENQQEKGEQ